MGKVLDLNSRLEAKKHQKSSPIPALETEEHLVNLGEMREKKIQEDRREVKRTILTEFVALHAVLPGFGLFRVLLSNINERGLAFDIEESKGSFRAGDPIELRVYLNHQTYFPIQVKVKHVQKGESEGLIRHGCEFLEDSLNEEAVQHFVAFLESVTASFRRDTGDVLVSKIQS
ncbi:MAG: PilZ domain-containing protein [Bdellovibrio sp.]